MKHPGGRPPRYPLAKMNQRNWLLVPWTEKQQIRHAIKHCPECRFAIRPRYDLTPCMWEVRLKP